MSINSAEDAYQCFANHLIAFVDDREWDVCFAKYEVYGKMSTARVALIKDNIEEKKGVHTKDPNAKWRGLDAALFIRDDILKATGKRIWGLTFTLFPDGKFEIEYDYNKPEDYEETDELISGEEINESLNNLNF
jgi:hypothetical protein